MAVRTMTSSNIVRTSYSSYGILCLLTGVLAIFDEELPDLVANFALGNLDIVLGGAVIGHEGEEAVVGDIKLSNV